MIDSPWQFDTDADGSPDHPVGGKVLKSGKVERTVKDQIGLLVTQAFLGGFLLILLGATIMSLSGDSKGSGDLLKAAQPLLLPGIGAVVTYAFTRDR